MKSRGRRNAWLGVGAWLAWLLATRPGLRSEAWAEALVLLAALVIVPLGLVPSLERRRASRPAVLALAVQPAAALCLIVALALERGAIAAAFCLPWLGVTALLALAGLSNLIEHRGRSLSALSLDAALLFIPIGAAWLVLSRLGARPLGFSDSIVLLTAVHFHYAGFAVPIALGAALGSRSAPTRIDRIAVAAVIGGVPLVAAGITGTQLGRAPLLEPLAAWVMVVGGLSTAALQIEASTRMPGQRAMLIASAIALGFGMLLAALYGGRTFWSIPLLDIPWMRALHGSANALGFALPALAAWSSAPSGPDAEGADEDGDRHGGGRES